MLCGLDALKPYWNTLAQNFCEKLNQHCPGRQTECESVVKVLQYNSIVQILHYTPLFPHVKTSSKYNWPIFPGINVQCSSGVSCFFRCLNKSHPCKLVSSDVSHHISQVKLPYASVDDFLHLSIQFDSFIDFFYHTSSSNLWRTSLHSLVSPSLDTSLSLKQKLFLIHERLVSSLKEDSSLENLFQSIIFTGNSLREVYDLCLHQILDLANQKSLNFWNALLCYQEEESQFMQDFILMGGYVFWVSFEGFNSVFEFKVAQDSIAQESFPMELLGSTLSNIIERVISTVKVKKLPVLFYYCTNSTKTWMHRRKDNDAHILEGTSSMRSCVTVTYCNKTPLLNWITQLFFPLPFETTLSLELRYHVILWFFKQLPSTNQWVLREPFLARLLECVSNFSISDIIKLLKNLVLQTVYESLKQPQERTEFLITFTETHLMEALKRLPSLSFSKSINLDTRMKKSLCEVDRCRDQWFPLSAAHILIWDSIDQTLIQPFFKANQKGWSRFFCLFQGETGSGKTHLAQYIADVCDVPTFRIFPSDIMKPLLGDSEKKLCEIFELALLYPPCLILFEAADTWCDAALGSLNHRKPEMLTSGVTMRLAIELLRQLDCLRLNYIKENKPSPILVILTVYPRKQHEASSCLPPLRQPHREALVIELPSPRDWSCRELAALFLKKNQGEISRCNQITENTSLLDAMTDVFIKKNIRFEGPAFVNEIRARIGRQRFKQAIQEETLSKKGDFFKKKNCGSLSLCLCDVISSLA